MTVGQAEIQGAAKTKAELLSFLVKAANPTGPILGIIKHQQHQQPGHPYTIPSTEHHMPEVIPSKGVKSSKAKPDAVQPDVDQFADILTSLRTSGAGHSSPAAPGTPQTASAWSAAPNQEDLTMACTHPQSQHMLHEHCCSTKLLARQRVTNKPHISVSLATALPQLGAAACRQHQQPHSKRRGRKVHKVDRVPVRTDEDLVRKRQRTSNQEDIHAQGKGQHTWARPIKGRTCKKEVADLINKVIEIPGHIFGVDVPDLYYRARVVGPDSLHAKAAVIRVAADKTKYYFPIGQVREWLQDTLTRCKSEPLNAQPFSTSDRSDVFAAEILALLAQAHFTIEGQQE